MAELEVRMVVRRPILANGNPSETVPDPLKQASMMQTLFPLPIAQSSPSYPSLPSQYLASLSSQTSLNSRSLSLSFSHGRRSGSPFRMVLTFRFTFFPTGGEAKILSKGVAPLLSCCMMSRYTHPSSSGPEITSAERTRRPMHCVCCPPKLPAPFFPFCQTGSRHLIASSYRIAPC